jgi:hypothetical protein
MIGQEYFSRQAATLLKLAGITRDHKVAVGLAAKAADLQSRFHEAHEWSEISSRAIWPVCAMHLQDA